MATNHQRDPFGAAVQHAHEWLAAVARRLETEDPHHAHRVLRTWLQLVRDRLTVDAGAHLGAQLPELLRGIYVEGWVPSRVPERYDATEFRARFAQAAGIPEDDVSETAAAVTTALRELFSAGQLDHALAQLPRPLRHMLYAGGTAGVPVPRPHEAAGTGELLPDRVDRLEAMIDGLAEAVRLLATGLEESPLDEPTTRRAATAAHEAHRILLASSGG